MNLVDEAESLMLYQFSGSQKLKALVRGLIKPFDDADDELQRLHNGRYIDEANGTILDIIGGIVGQLRNDMSDEDYRPWIKVAICLNNGNGTPENVFNVLSILFGKTPPISMEEDSPNIVTFTFYEESKFPTKAVFAIIRSATPVTTVCNFKNAAPPRPTSESEFSVLDSNHLLSVFRFDHTAFDESFFADFFEGE